MALNSRSKGKTGELEACSMLRQLFGWTCRRSQQFSGWAKGGNSPDILVDQTPSLFWEIKRVERLQVSRALLTAVKQSGRKCAVLMHRQNRSQVGWMITVRLEDLPRLAHAYQIASDAETQEGNSVAEKELSDDKADTVSGCRRAARSARPNND